MALRINNPTAEYTFPGTRAWHCDQAMQKLYGEAATSEKRCPYFSDSGTRNRVVALQHKLGDACHMAKQSPLPIKTRTVFEKDAPLVAVSSCIGAGGFGGAFRVHRREKAAHGEVTRVMKVSPNVEVTRDSWAAEVFALKRLAGVRQVAGMVGYEAHPSFLYVFLEQAQFGSFHSRVKRKPFSDDELLGYIT